MLRGAMPCCWHRAARPHSHQLALPGVQWIPHRALHTRHFSATSSAPLLVPRSCPFRPTSPTPTRSPFFHQPTASFASKAAGGNKDEKPTRSKKKKKGETAGEEADATSDSTAPATSAPVPASVDGSVPVRATTATLSREGMERLSHVLSSSPSSAPTSYPTPPPRSSPASITPAPRTRLPLTQTPPSSLRIPLTPGSDVIDPSISVLVRRSTVDDLVMEQIIDTRTKLVASKPELSLLIKRERDEERAVRASRRLSLRSRQSSSDETSRFAGEEEEYVYAIEEYNENEQLIAENPESMRRQHAIDLKQIRLDVRERMMELEEADDREKDQQTAASEEQRTANAERLRRLDAHEADSDEAFDEYDPVRRLQEEEAQEALDAARLRENAVFRWRDDYGEREGDDYVMAEEERIYEKDDQPPPPPPKKENVRAKLRPREVDLRGRSFGYGGRKTSTAQVWIQPGNGECRVNNVNHAVYFTRFSHRACLIRPFEVVDRMGMYDIRAFTSGGGKTGQSGAIQLGIARALVKQEPLLRERLKEEGMLTRDPRKVERKKPGQPKARKRYTFIKR